MSALTHLRTMVRASALPTMLAGEERIWCFGARGTVMLVITRSAKEPIGRGNAVSSCCKGPVWCLPIPLCCAEKIWIVSSRRSKPFLRSLMSMSARSSPVSMHGCRRKRSWV